MSVCLSVHVCPCLSVCLSFFFCGVSVWLFVCVCCLCNELTLERLQFEDAQMPHQRAAMLLGWKDSMPAQAWYGWVLPHNSTQEDMTRWTSVRQSYLSFLIQTQSCCRRANQQEWWAIFQDDKHETFKKGKFRFYIIYFELRNTFKQKGQNKSQWHRVTDNTKLRPQGWQRTNEKKKLTEQESMTQSDWQHKIETTRVTEEEWKKDSQNKSQWQRVIDSTRLRPLRWQRMSQKKQLTEQESMTESDWQHKIETTKMTEN